MFRYQVSSACKHIKPIPNCHYLPWELTQVWDPPAVLCGLHQVLRVVERDGSTQPQPTPLILDLLMAKLGLNLGEANGDHKVLSLCQSEGMGCFS